MKRLTQILPLLLAAALQVLPLLRNIVTAPAASSSFAIVLRWTLGSSAAIGAFDACSGATNSFTTPTNLTGTVGVPFTNNLALLTSGGDPGAVCTITSNGVSVFLIANGQTTNFALPAGLIIKFVDVNPIYDAIYGIPTKVGTNTFAVSMSYPGATTISTAVTIKILAGSSPPVITNQPAGFTNVAGGNATYTVVAGGVPAPAYQWKWNGSTVLPNATNASLSLTNLRASQAGTYSVTITNAGGVTNSLLATLVVTNPLPTRITSPTNGGGVFKFTFIPTVGLTNSVQTNNVLAGGSWGVLTNVPPPATASPVTVTDSLGSSNCFYRVLIQP